MDKKDNDQGNNKDSVGGKIEKARNTIMKTLSAVVAGFTDMSGSGGTNIPTSVIPAPAPPGSSGSTQSASAATPQGPPPDKVKPPRDMTSLLRMCNEISEPASVTGRSTLEEMDPERREFLAEAIVNFATANNIVEKVRQAVERLSVGPLSTAEEVEKQLEDLKFVEYHVDELDLANDFIKLGGLPVILKYLQSPDKATRKIAYNILAVVPQNNPFAWSFYQQLNILPILLEMLVQESEEECVDAGFSAVSCLIRGNANGILQLKGHNGEDLIYTVLLQSERTKTLRKAGYILRSLMLYDKEHGGPGGEPRDLYKAILQELCDRIRARKSSRDTLGACLQVMYYIFCEYEELVKNYVKPELGLTSFVQEILATEPTEDDSVDVLEAYSVATDLKPMLGLEESE